MLRLVAYAPNGVERFAVDRRRLLLGSGDDCDVRLGYPGVAKEHARLEVVDGQVFIEDLGSRKGVLVNGERIRRESLQTLDEIRLGSIALLLEDVVRQPGPRAGPEEEPPPGPRMTPARMLDHLAKVSRWVLADAASSNTLESLVIELLIDFGGGVLFLFQGEQRGIKFVAASEGHWLGNGDELLRQVDAEGPPGDEVSSFLGHLDDQPAWIAMRALYAHDRPYHLALALPRYRPEGENGEEPWLPHSALRTLADQLILGLVHHVGRYEPIVFGSRQSSALTLAPGLVVGESQAMKRAMDQLRAVVDQPVHVLLRGEPGVSKEKLAHSLHLSSERREGTFAVVRCQGADPRQIEADLFGAEVPGKNEVLVREGKLQQADGGTLYLEGVEHLPLALQGRLVRFVHSSTVEPVGSLASHPVDVRLVTSSEEPLEEHAARDKFRIDLAYRLSQFVVDVPALRDRREDLPLLIQATVNRCCHQTGKRVQGITVQALEALAIYDYPGNLPELENIVRQLVYLCPSGQPIDEKTLPDSVRLAKVKGLRPETTSELALDKLVADCERAAIREAMRRSHGNKSEAARLLGLSRNGLAMKINRLGL